MFRVVVLCLLGYVLLAQASSMPSLNCISTIVFPQAYSDPNGSYNTSALFLSSYAKETNTPDLLYYTSDPIVFYVATAGNDIGLIASVPASQSLKSLNWESVDRSGLQFYQAPYDTDSMTFAQGQIYSALGMKQNVRAGFYFEIVNVDGKKLALDYAVKFYEIHSVTSSSPGFNWTAPSSKSC